MIRSEAATFAHRQTTAEAVVAALLAEGVETVYALPGLQSDPLFDAFHKAGEALRVIHPRHEQAAGYMALGAALATGRPQVCSVVPGPGFLNVSAALLTAYSMNAPVVALVGQIPQVDIDRGHGHLHELHDQLGIARHFCKHAERIGAPHEAAAAVARAFHIAHSGKPGPVVLECSMDVLARAGQTPAPCPAGPPQRPPVDLSAVARAAEILSASRRPLIVVGGGAQDASEQVRALAERLEAPVMGYRRGTGVLPSDHRLSVPLSVAHRLWKDADVVIGIGTRLHTQQSMWGVDPGLKVVRIDIDPAEPDRLYPAAAALIGDAADQTAALAAAITGERASREQELAAHRAWFAGVKETLAPQVAWLEALRAALPEDGVFVDEVTQVGFVSRLAFPVHHPRSFLSPGYQDNLGWGIGTALGVQAAQPGRPVLAISGDGGFLYQVGELATAALHDLPVVFVVFDNAMFGNVKRIQQERYGNRVIAADLASPDFVALARAFGIGAARADTPEALRIAVSEGFASRRPTLVHVKCGPMPSPWPFILMPRVRG